MVEFKEDNLYRVFVQFKFTPIDYFFFYLLS